MTIYIALLRGINVGGKNMIKMAELKKVLQDLGLCDVKTYIQSGNVLFKSNEEEGALKIKIENAIEAEFGFPVPVILRKAEELEKIAASCPFSEEAVKSAEATSEGESLYVSLMQYEPSKEAEERVVPYRTESDEYVIMGREVYLLFHKSIRNSKLANNLHKLGSPSTVRNWKTLNKLIELSKEMK